MCSGIAALADAKPTKVLKTTALWERRAVEIASHRERLSIKSG